MARARHAAKTAGSAYAARSELIARQIKGPRFSHNGAEDMEAMQCAGEGRHARALLCVRWRELCCNCFGGRAPMLRGRG